MAEALKDQVAIVTGAGRGIGRAVALALAREGAIVVLASRTKASLQGTMDEIGAAGGAGMVMPTDLAEEADIRRLVAEVDANYGRLNILVNNAGVAAKGLLLDTSTETWDRLMRVNARGPFLLCRDAIPLMKQAGGSVVVNVASVVGVKGYPEQAAYTASKHALMGMTKVLAQEVKPDNIRVHAVCPGGVATDMVKEMRPDIDDDLLMSPDEIADIVLFLVTHRGNAVIDQINVRRAASTPWF